MTEPIVKYCPACGSTTIHLQPIVSRNGPNGVYGEAYDYYCNTCGNSGDIDMDKAITHAN